ncbi:MAG: hypothetical protein A3F10_03615 [Coxiella sp. RIFCSPHIGHO2_12_FULL_42_15]|nr:MAG: hypothetical protein A3F10_03615 [Coxiella sp. RIFCSPHIGHO2_12_FULL_42_15]
MARFIHFLLRLLIFIGFSSGLTAQELPLPADQAFQLTTVYINNNHDVVTKWNIKPNYFLYHPHFQFHVIEPSTIELGPATFPKSTLYKTHPNGKIMPVYTGQFQIIVPIRWIPANVTQMQLEIHYQGCSNLGVCYPELQKTAKISLMHPAANFIEDKSTTEKHPTTQGYLTHVLQRGHLTMVIAVFFGIGILLSLTPCVLPMIPILSSIIMGQKQVTHARSFGLSLAYVFGMAITYAALGLLVGLLGASVQAALQKTWIIVLFALLMMTMAFSLFGFFSLELPQFLRHRVAIISDHQKHGHYLGSFAMGVLSTLILSPCVTPALATAILYIAHRGDAALGATALFSLGVGMGIPLLMVGASSATWLPKTGHWMNNVKIFLGFVMLGVAIGMLSRVLSAEVSMLLWALLGTSAAIALRAFNSTRTVAQHIAKAIGILLFIYSIIIGVGAWLGNTNPLKPIVFASTKQDALLKFHDITSLEEFQQQRQYARRIHKPMLLDFFADWCVECHKLDAYTFSHPVVQALLTPYVLVRANVTTNSLENRLLERHFGVVAPPTLLFFTPEGKELPQYRIIGDIRANALIQHLQSVKSIYY